MARNQENGIQHLYGIPQKNLCGAYGPYLRLDEKAQEIWDKIPKRIGIECFPLCVATQIVAGTNYKFLCETKIMYPDAEPYNLCIVIWEKLDGSLIEVECYKYHSPHSCSC